MFFAMVGGNHERLYWSGLALTRRDYLNGKEVVSSERYLNEPHATGGNPVLVWEGKAAPASAKERAKEAATRLLFTDMLGSTVSVIDGDKAQDTGMTLFGETPDGQGAGFFTGKPHIDELGYAFLFRNYRPEKAKWQTADPLGYPDGWNALAYVNNGAGGTVDRLGLSGWKIGVRKRPEGRFLEQREIILSSDEKLKFTGHFSVNEENNNTEVVVKWTFFSMYCDEDIFFNDDRILDIQPGTITLVIDQTGKINYAGVNSFVFDKQFDGGLTDYSGHAGGAIALSLDEHKSGETSDVMLHLGLCFGYTLSTSGGMGINAEILSSGGGFSFTGSDDVKIDTSVTKTYILRRWYEE